MSCTKKLFLLLVIVLLPVYVPANEKLPAISRFDAPIFTVSCNVTVFTSPDSSYTTLEKFISSAQHNISIMIYSISNPFLLGLLNERIAAGVDVTVILSPRHASGAETSYTRYAAYNLSLAGAFVYWANTTEFRYTHAKFMIIDNRTVIIESANWAKTGIPKDPSYGNREWGIAITEPNVVHYFEEVFDNDLSIASSYNNENGTAVGTTVTKGKYPHPFNATEITGNMKIQPLVSPDSSEEAILSLLNSANKSIYVNQDYIYKNWDDEISPFLTALVNAKNRGVDVKVTMNPTTISSKENEKTAAYLAGYGIEVRFTNTTYFARTHNKGVIVDGKAVLISSINWNENSVRNNREAGVIVYNTDVAEYFEEVFLWDWSVAQPYEGEAETPPQPIDPMIMAIAIVIVAIGIVMYIAKNKEKFF